MSTTPDQVRETINQYVQAWATGDKALLLSIFAEDASWEDPVGTPAFIGHEGIEQFWNFAYPTEEGRSLTPVPHQIIACGNEGILRFTMQVRVPAENKGLDLLVTDHFEINNAGKIQRARAFWDESCVSCPDSMEMFVPDMSAAHG